MASGKTAAVNQKAPSCTRCGKRDSDLGGNWCKDCKDAAAAYQRGYRSADEIRARALGIKELREFLADRFEEYGSAGFSGSEISRIIRQAVLPRDKTSDAPSESDGRA